MTMKGDPGLRLEHRVKLVKTSLNMLSRINTLGVFAAGAAYLGLSPATAALRRGPIGGGEGRGSADITLQAMDSA